MANNSSILKTLIYSDIFDYPLIKEEIWKFLIGENIDSVELEKALTEFPPEGWEHKERWFFLPGRGEIVSARIKRLKKSRRKIVIAKRIVKVLSFIPTVLFIGISGGLAIENADEKDDIDLFVISSKNSLWISRLLLVFLLILIGQYRGRGKKKSQKVCLNMIIDEEALELKRHDLYVAHEVVQLRPMFDRHNTYNKFLSENRWVRNFLPNSIEIKKLSNKVIKERKNNYSITNLLNYLAKITQLLYMKKHITKETVSDHILAFHPFDYGEYVLKEYNKRLKRYDL